MPLVAKPTGIKECNLLTIERLAQKFVIQENGCWEWIANKSKEGYGQFSIKSRSKRAHRVVWELVGGIVESHLQLDHLCRNRACVNPKHLEQVDNKTNTLRGDTIPAMHARKTHCARGHLLQGDNLYIKRTYNKPTRVCRICSKDFVYAFRRRLATAQLTKGDSNAKL